MECCAPWILSFSGAIRPLSFGIEDYDVGKAADGEGAAAFEAEQRGGLRAEQAEDAAEGQLPLLVQPAQAEAEGCFKAGDAVGRVLELDFFLVRGVRRVVGGDGVDDAVEDALRSWRRDRRPSAAADSFWRWVL